MATVQELVEATESQTTAVLALNQTITTERSRRRFTRLAMVLGFLLLAGLAVIGGMVLYQGRENGETLDILKSATTPGRPLYEKGQDRTEGLICRLIDNSRQVHGIDIVQYPCDKPLPIKPETAPTNLFRGEDGFCVGMRPEDVARLELTPDPSCQEG